MKCLGGLRVAGATLITLCLAWCCTSCSPAVSRLSASSSVASVTPGKQLWASTLRDAGTPVEAASPDGTRLFVSGQGKVGFETVAYSAATGAQLWARAYQPATYSNPTAITVSPDGARVYVTGDTAKGGATVAYDTRTGKQLWARRATLTAYAASELAVSPDSATVYVAGSGFGVIAYAAATGKQRWLRSYTKATDAWSVAVSADGKTVYVTGSGVREVESTGSTGESVLTVAYTATGTMKWATRYKNPYADVYDAGTQVLAGPGGNIVYVVGRAANKSGQHDIATFAYRAATGKQLWLHRYHAELGGSAPRIAVTPDGQTVIVTGALSNGRTGYAALAAYHASTGETHWTAKAPLVAGPTGLVIDPHGNTVIIGGRRIAAYSVAHGTVLWTASYPARRFPTAIALSGDCTRLFETGWNGRGITGGITTVAYHT